MSFASLTDKFCIYYFFYFITFQINSRAAYFVGVGADDRNGDDEDRFISLQSYCKFCEDSKSATSENLCGF